MCGFSEEQKLRRIYAEATGILDRELKGKWRGFTYEQTIQENFMGFASIYLAYSANYEQFASSAKIPIMLDLAKLDLQKGTTIAQLVHSCCLFFPIKEALQKLIELGNEEAVVAKSVLEFEDHTGYNCLISLFNMAAHYRNITYDFPPDSKLHQIEEICFYLIGLGKSHNVDMKKILNHTANEGTTLFSYAASFSERLTKYLIEEVKVNSIDFHFFTPIFRVRPETNASKTFF